MATATLPRSAEFLVATERPTFVQIRAFRRTASQDVFERKELVELYTQGLDTKTDKDIPQASATPLIFW